MKWQSIILVLFIYSFSQKSEASSIDSINYDSIRNIEYQLEGLSNNIINSPDLQERITSCYYFVQTLKRALKVPQSFEYEFESLKTVSMLKPDDDKFRVFTWNLLLDSGEYMYFGAIQMNNSDSLVLYGLYDSSTVLKDALYETVDNHQWIGALYYQIHPYKFKGQKYYLMMGWDGEDSRVNKKVIDLLWFDQQDKPHFGAPFFDMDGDIQNRVIFEFSDKAVMLCRYEPNFKSVVFAHMVPPNPLQKGMYEYYIPDGTYDYLLFEKGFWIKSDLYYKDKSKGQHDLRKY